MDIGYAWLGGDQLTIVIRNDGDKAVSDIRLRLRFRSGDDWPRYVDSGIRGYEPDGKLIPESRDLAPGDEAKVRMKVPQQGANKWFVTWITEEGMSDQDSGEIEGG